MQPQRLSRAWRTAAWIRRLSGMTLPPSTVARGVESWISSLRDSRARRSASPASVGASTTSGGCGPTLPRLFAKLRPDGSFSKTSQDSCLPTMEPHLPKYCETWPGSGSMRSGECFERPMPAPRTEGRGSSSWQTPRKMDAHGAGYQNQKDGSQTATLSGQARLWPTPAAEPYGTNQGGSAGRVGPVRPSLETMARSSRPDQPTPKDGGDGSKPTRTLNPRFVEALMGFPTGWINCEQPVMGFARFKRRMRSALSRLG